MFLFKKIVSQFFFPMPLCLFLCFTGLALLWFTQRQKAGKLLVTAGLLLLTALSCSPLADALLLPLERQYPPYVKRNGEHIKYVVVLGGGHNSDEALPASSQLSNESLKRLVEGINVYRENPGSKLILSGGSWLDRLPDATLMADIARSLGIDAADILQELESKDTEHEARLIKTMVGTNHFALVTSANHLPRSMTLFRRQDLNPIPVPSEFIVKHSPMSLGRLLPSGHALIESERAFYEYMGGIWIRIRR